MSAVYLLLGSNQGDKTEILKMAVEGLQKLSVKPAVKSSFYESEPWGFESKEWFVNQAVKIDTILSPEELLKEVLRIEENLGRKRVNGGNDCKNARIYSSRKIDIDIILWDDMAIDIKNLTIPHPRMHLRKFVLMPICEIDPLIVHPILKKSIEKLLKECDDNSKVIKMNNNAH